VKRKRFSVEQIVAVLKQAEAGVPRAALIRRVGISEQTFYRWKKQYVGLEVDQVRQLRQLQEENSRLKRLVDQKSGGSEFPSNESNEEQDPNDNNEMEWAR
jgi:putative transposase